MLNWSGKKYATLIDLDKCCKVSVPMYDDVLAKLGFDTDEHELPKKLNKLGASSTIDPPSLPVISPALLTYGRATLRDSSKRKKKN